MTFTDEEMKKCFQILDELLEEYNIPNKLSPDGISRIDGMTVEEYFKNHDLWDRDNYKDYDLEKVYEQSMRK
jgi:hypothetical protein